MLLVASESSVVYIHAHSHDGVIVLTNTPSQPGNIESMLRSSKERFVRVFFPSSWKSPKKRNRKGKKQFFPTLVERFFAPEWDRTRMKTGRVFFFHRKKMEKVLRVSQWFVEWRKESWKLICKEQKPTSGDCVVRLLCRHHFFQLGDFY